MRCFSVRIGSALLILLGAALGCPRSAGPPSDNTGFSATNEFTAERQAAVRLIVQQLIATTRAIATFRTLADPRLNLNSGTVDTFGTCPTIISFGTVGQRGSALFDYGDGCTAAAFGTATVAGQVETTPALDGQTFRISLQNLTIDNRRVTGFLNALPTGETGDFSELAVGGELNTEDVGKVLGAFVIGFTESGEIVLSGPDVSLESDDKGYVVDLDGVTVAPLDNDNFVPEAGTLQFVDNALVEIIVTFSERAAEEGVVRVIVGDGTLQNFAALTATDLAAAALKYEPDTPAKPIAPKSN